MMYMATVSDFASLDTNPISDLLGKDTLDVSVLKKDAPDAPEKAFVNEAEENDARADELASIEAFIAKHGVTKPTEEDFVPKKRSWGGKSKAEKLAANPNYVERRGRPRRTFSKNVTFVRTLQADKGLVDHEGKDEFKRAGRGRAKKGEVREVFVLHHANVDKVSEGTWTRKELEAMANAS